MTCYLSAFSSTGDVVMPRQPVESQEKALRMVASFLVSPKGDDSPTLTFEAKVKKDGTVQSLSWHRDSAKAEEIQILLDEVHSILIESRGSVIPC